MNFTTLFQTIDFSVSSKATQAPTAAYNSILSHFQADAKNNFFYPFDAQNQQLATAVSLTPTRSNTDCTSVTHSAPECVNYAPFDENSESSPSSPLQEGKQAVYSAGSSGVQSTSPASLEDDAHSEQSDFDELINVEDEEEREMLRSKGWRATDDQTLLSLASKYKCDWKKISKKFDNKKFTPYFLKIRYKELIDAPVQKKHKFTEAEDLQLARLYKTIGSDWNELAKHFKNRTGVMLKNRYYSYIRKRGLLDELVAKAESHSTSQEPRTTQESLVEIVASSPAVEKVQETFLEKKPEVQIFDFSELNFSQTCFEFEGLQDSDELHTKITPMNEENFFADNTCSGFYGSRNGQFESQYMNRYIPNMYRY